MIKRKICMLGSPTVGKTSLVSRFVNSLFSEKYLATVGVKIDQKTLQVGEQQVNLILWDFEGVADLRTFQSAYLRGASAYLLVADGTRPQTLDAAVHLQQQVASVLGPVPFALAVNKSDLQADWQVARAELDRLSQEGWTVFQTSAKTGRGVEAAFRHLASVER